MKLKLFCRLRIWWDQEFIFGDEKLTVKHNWRYKLLHLVSDLALDVGSVVFVIYSAISFSALD